MIPERPPIASVEQVREELRRLGYLDSGLDRFVLAGAGGASPLRTSLDVALRVGIAGGVLFGLALTLAALSLDRRLLQEPRDLAVLLLYLVLGLGALMAVMSLVGSLIAAWAGRRLGRKPGPTLSRNVGLAMALLALAYLALWWRSRAAGMPFLAQVAALAVGLLLSVVMARFVSLAAVAVLSAGGVADRLPQASLTRRRLLVFLLAGALCFGGGLALAPRLGSEAETEPPDFAVVPTGLRVRVLGIDGLERRMTEQMLERGQMPRLAALMKTGAHGRLQAEPEAVPAIVWTTIATGRGPAAHGIKSTGVRRLAGMRTPVPLGEQTSFARALGTAADVLRITRNQPSTSVLRGIKTFWNVASEKGLRVGVVNWWATWPADPVNGYMVSDRAFFKIEKGGAPEREVYPPEAFARLKTLSLTGGGGDRARRIDLFHVAAARALRETHPPDLEALYLPGLDIITTQQLEEVGESDLATLDARVDAVRAYYRFVDGSIERFAEELKPADVLIIVGDPGRLARRSSEPPEGTLVLAGGPVVPWDLGAVAERDLTPTVLHLVGLPASRELEGAVLVAALDPKFHAAHPVRKVSTYGRPPAIRPAESAFDRQMLEELRSLGYIK